MFKKKVLFLIPTLMHGGAEKVLVNLVNNLDSNRYDITLFSIFDKGVNRDFLKKGISYRFKFKKMFRGNTHFFKLFPPKFLYRWIIKEHYDIAIAYLEGPAARIIAGCTHPDTKKIAWIHIELIDGSHAAVGFRDLSEARKYYESFDYVAAVSKTVLELFRKNISATVPSGVLYNTNETTLIKEMALVPPPFGFRGDGVNLISVAKIVPSKGYERLLDVHARLLKEGYRHTINILGIGEEKEKLEAKAKKLGLQDSFRFLGFDKNPYRYIAHSDLYICSSFREGFSTAVSEALILGTPVVSTDCSGAKEMLGAGNEYGIVTENSEEGIYEGLKQMLEDPSLLAHYKKQAQLRGGFFSTDRTVSAVENLFNSL